MENSYPQAPAGTRRHDLDWLRVLAFGLLILYHVGMYYVADWGWHIKSPETSTALQNLMLLVNPWRMSLLFFVSGAALYFACGRISRTNLLQLRTQRLLLPLVFGMAVIVPPQLYVELKTQAGFSGDYVAFYALYMDFDTQAYPEYQYSPLGVWTWNHLWFLAYLWVYTLAFALLKPLLDRLTVALRSASLSPALVLLVPVALLVGYRALLADDFPPNNAMSGDWYNHARYFSLMILGYLLADHSGFWRAAERGRWWWLGGAILAYGIGMAIFHGRPAQLPGMDPERLQTAVLRVVVSFDQWLWMLAVLGFGKRHLNRTSPLLRYMNQAILPWYILHQTLTVLLAFWLAPIALPIGLEAVILLAGTVAGCALGYELVRRFYLGRLLFGLKTGRAGQSRRQGRAANAPLT